jgi:hypothetical protein
MAVAASLIALAADIDLQRLQCRAAEHEPVGGKLGGKGVHESDFRSRVISLEFCPRCPLEASAMLRVIQGKSFLLRRASRCTVRA